MLEEAEGSMAESRYLWGVSKRVDLGRSGIVKRIGLAKPETIERDGHFSRFKFHSHGRGKTCEKVYQMLVTVCIYFK